MGRIVAKDLTISYGTRSIIQSLDIEIPDNKITTIIGPNGCGKSTLLKAIMGLQNIDTGKVSLEGLQRKDIAYLPQQSDIDRSQPISVYELAAMGLWYEIGFFGGTKPAQRERVHAAL